MTIQTILHSETTWLVAAYLLNSLASIVVAKVSRTGTAWRIVRLAHGILDKVDPPAPKP